MDRQAWLMERKKGIGSSAAPAVCGLSKWKTPLEAYLGYVHDEPEREPSAPMRWGTLLEPVVARAYADATGRTLVKAPAILRHPEHPFMLASVDYQRQQDGRIVEIKTSRFGDGFGEPGTDEVPEDYLVQTQHQMAVLDAQVADVPVLIGGSDFRVYTVRRNEALIADIVKIESDFWNRVLERRPPAPDWRHPSTPKLIEKLYRPAEGKVIDLGAEADELVDEWKAQAKAENDAEKAKDMIKAKLVALLGDAAQAVLPSGRTLNRRKIERAGHVVQPSSYYGLTLRKGSAQ